MVEVAERAGEGSRLDRWIGGLGNCRRSGSGRLALQVKIWRDDADAFENVIDTCSDVRAVAYCRGWGRAVQAGR